MGGRVGDKKDAEMEKKTEWKRPFHVLLSSLGVFGWWKLNQPTKLKDTDAIRKRPC